MPRIIKRGEWGAKGAKSVSYAKWPTGVTLWVHHTEGIEPAPNASVETEKQVMRGLQTFHQNTRGWSDIGYSYVIMPSGRIYEGRGYGIRGAHCPGHNNEPSVAFAGSYDDHLPTKAALDAVYYVATITRSKTWRGHREGYSTSCPGDRLYRWVVTHRPSRGPAPTPIVRPKKTLAQRLKIAGLGKKSVDAVLKALGRTK